MKKKFSTNQCVYIYVKIKKSSNTIFRKICKILGMSSALFFLISFLKNIFLRIVWRVLEIPPVSIDRFLKDLTLIVGTSSSRKRWEKTLLEFSSFSVTLWVLHKTKINFFLAQFRTYGEKKVGVLGSARGSTFVTKTKKSNIFHNFRFIFLRRKPLINFRIKTNQLSAYHLFMNDSNSEATKHFTSPSNCRLFFLRRKQYQLSNQNKSTQYISSLQTMQTPSTKKCRTEILVQRNEFQHW